MNNNKAPKKKEREQMKKTEGERQRETPKYLN